MKTWIAKCVCVARVTTLLGCVGAGELPTADEDDAGSPSQESTDASRALIPENWAGAHLGLGEPIVEDLGPVELVVDTSEPEQPPMVEGDEEEHEESAEADVEGGQVIVGDNGREYLLHLPISSALDALVERRLDEGLDEAGEVAQGEATEAMDPAIEKGRVGRDDRRRYGIRDGYSANDWLASIGVMTLAADYNRTTCTATLVSRDVVLTAAHCLVKAATGGGHRIRPAAFHPRADRSQATRYPWGNWTWTGRYYYDPAFVSSGCHTRYTPSCAKHDWALIRFARPATASGLGLYMRYKTVANGAMVGLKNRGYAGCGLPESPPNCISHTLFGDVRSCAPGITDNSNDGGYSMAVSHSCDTNPGHSGSPLYFYDSANRGRPTIVGVHVSDNGIAGDLLRTGNWMRHVTPSMVSKINSVLSTL